MNQLLLAHLDAQAILMLAHQLGYRLRDQAAYGIWQWDELWKEHGFASRTC
jgi:hypothetical protein